MSNLKHLKYSIFSREIFTIPRSQPRRNSIVYKTLVRPHLDYATSAWDPFTSKNIKDLERVQNTAARFTTSTYGRDTSVISLKESLGWLPLQERRRASRLTCLYKMLNGTLDIDHQKYIAPKNTFCQCVNLPNLKMTCTLWVSWL